MGNIMKWYHVTICYREKEFTFIPHIPYYLRKGEDKRTPRICVTTIWRHSLRSIILIKMQQEYYIYSTEEQPVNPIEIRKKLLKEKKIRKNCNDYQMLEDGFINKEHWFIKPVKMKLEGVIELSKKDYAGMLMGFGFCNEPDVDKLKLKPYKKKSIEELLRGN
jgi:hypothetical protein